MADSDLVRQRRSRAHRKGDHSLCEGCAAPVTASGGMVAAVRAALEEAGRAETYLGAFALALAARVDGCEGVSGVAPVVHELRETMTAALAGASKAGRLREMRQSHARKG